MRDWRSETTGRVVCPPSKHEVPDRLQPARRRAVPRAVDEADLWLSSTWVTRITRYSLGRRARSSGVIAPYPIARDALPRPSLAALVRVEVGLPDRIAFSGTSTRLLWRWCLQDHPERWRQHHVIVVTGRGLEWRHINSESSAVTSIGRIVARTQLSVQGRSRHRGPDGGANCRRGWGYSNPQSHPTRDATATGTGGEALRAGSGSSAPETQSGAGRSLSGTSLRRWGTAVAG